MDALISDVFTFFVFYRLEWHYASSPVNTHKLVKTIINLKRQFSGRRGNFQQNFFSFKKMFRKQIILTGLMDIYSSLRSEVCVIYTIFEVYSENNEMQSLNNHHENMPI